MSVALSGLVLSFASNCRDGAILNITIINININMYVLLLKPPQAPEHLCSQARSQQLELRFLHQLLTLHLATQQKMEREAELLHASDQKGI